MRQYRAIACSQTGAYFTKEFENDAECAHEGISLSLLHKSPEEDDEEVLFLNKFAAVCYLELCAQQLVASRLTWVYGALLFEGNESEYLETRFVPFTDLGVGRKVRLHVFTFADITRLTENRDYEKLRSVLTRSVLRTWNCGGGGAEAEKQCVGDTLCSRPYLTRKIASSSACYFIQSDFVALISQRVKILIDSHPGRRVDGCPVVWDEDGSRTLQAHERVYLYLHILLRHPRKVQLDPDNANRLIDAIRIHHPLTVDERTAENAFFQMQFCVESRHLDLWRDLALSGAVAKIETAYAEGLARFHRSCREGTRVYDLFERASRRYAHNTLYTGRLINELMRDCIYRIPGSLLHEYALRDWVDETVLRVADSTKPLAYYSAVCQNLRPVFEHNSPLLLYGDVARFYVPESTYRVVRTTSMKDTQWAKGRDVFAPGQKTRCVTYSYFHNDKGGPSLLMRFLAAHALPAFTYRDGSRWRFKFLVPITAAEEEEEEDDEDDEGKEEEEEEEEEKEKGLPLPRKRRKSRDAGQDTVVGFLREVYESGGTHSEIISSEMNISTLLLDIDLHTPLPVNIASLCRDLVSLIEMVLHNVPQFVDKLRIMVFQSTPIFSEREDGGKKHGFHCHVRLPDGYVMKCSAVQEVVGMLEEMRHLYPNTLGSATAGEVFDSNIYKTSRDKNTWHGLRMPNQTNEKFEKRLRCVYRTDGLPLEAPVPLECVYAHSSMNRQLGSVVVGWEGRVHLEDEAFIKQETEEAIDLYATNQCKNTAREVMEELNARCVAVPSESVLLECLNQEWRATGKLAMRRRLERATNLNSARYTPQEIEEALRDSKIVVAKEDGSLRVISGKTGARRCFAICPAKKHEHAEPIVVELRYDRRMVKIGFQLRTFKLCRKGFLDDVYLELDDLVHFSTLRKKFDYMLLELTRKCDVYHHAPSEEDPSKWEWLLSDTRRLSESEARVMRVYHFQDGIAVTRIEFGGHVTLLNGERKTAHIFRDTDDFLATDLPAGCESVCQESIRAVCESRK